MEEFIALGRQESLAITPQRMAIFEALLGRDDHPRAEEIYSAVRRRFPTISLATVHRTLETLCRVGAARKVTPLHDSARYDANIAPHHHVICVKCRRVRDIESPELDGVIRDQLKLGEFRAHGYAIEVHALCERCIGRR